MKYLIIFLLCASSAFCELGGVNGVAVEVNAHFVGSADSISYTPTVAKDVFTKLVPVMVSHEADYITFGGDTLTIQAGHIGDYTIQISVRMSGSNANDIWQIKVYKNAVKMPTSIGQFIFRTTSAGLADTKSYFWYLQDLAEGDDISFYVTNLSASRNPTFDDFKIMMIKIMGE